MHRLIRLIERRPLVAVGALLVLVLLVGLGPRLVPGGDDGHAPDRGSRELIAVAVALTYVRLVEVGDQRSACFAVTADLAKTSGCDTASPRMRACGKTDPDGARVLHYAPPVATVNAGRCTLMLRAQTTGDWQVAAVDAR